MSDQPDETIDDAGLTKPKKIRTEAQKAATERMRTALEAKQVSSGKMSNDEKKLRLQAIKEQLNGPLKKNMPKTPTIPAATVSESESESEDDAPVPPPPPVAPVPKRKQPKIVSQPAAKKKEPKIVYESSSESEEEVIIVKKKKKPKKKTIIYEDATESEEEEPVAPVRKQRETKTQQNASSKFKVTQSDSKPKGPIYYFAD